jgi:hypothetical protein
VNQCDNRGAFLTQAAADEALVVERRSSNNTDFFSEIGQELPGLSGNESKP